MADLDDGAAVPTKQKGDPGISAEFGVSTEIHENDFIFQWQSENNKGSREQNVESYLRSGAYSARQVGTIVDANKTWPGRRLTMLEFASGYGCVTRHLKLQQDKYDVTACDIHEDAVKFIRDEIGMAAILSHREPEDLRVDRHFDVVFALSFFTHMPHGTFRRWLGKLLEVTSTGGLLVFTTSGRSGHRHTNFQPLNDDGLWFAPMGEQKDLPQSDYGATVVAPRYVVSQLATLPDAMLVFYQESFWWGYQDVYVVQKQPVGAFVGPVFSPVEFRAAEDVLAGRISALQAEIASLKASRSWRITRPLRTAGRLLRRQSR